MELVSSLVGSGECNRLFSFYKTRTIQRTKELGGTQIRADNYG
jgi:hypothetical protein